MKWGGAAQTPGLLLHARPLGPRHTTFSQPKQVIGQPRSKGWGNRFYLFSERGTIESRGKYSEYREELKKFGASNETWHAGHHKSWVIVHP